MTVDRLAQMMDMQRTLQRRYYDGRDPDSFSMDDLCAYVQIMTHSAQHELGEAMDEVGWKPWAASRHMNREQFRAELIDVWHFFMNLMLAGGMSADDLYRGYMEKNAVNHERIAKGYDGRKCRCCGKEFMDEATECTPNGCADPHDEAVVHGEHDPLVRVPPVVVADAMAVLANAWPHGQPVRSADYAGVPDTGEYSVGGERIA